MFAEIQVERFESLVDMPDLFCTPDVSERSSIKCILLMVSRSSAVWTTIRPSPHKIIVAS